jgi:hypothetical protein
MTDRVEDDYQSDDEDLVAEEDFVREDITAESLDIEPWAEPVDGQELLDALVGQFNRYLSLEPGAAEILSLFTVATHAIEICRVAPRVFLKSPVKECGKTTTLGILGAVTRRPEPTSNITPSSMFRVIDSRRPTLLIDEMDTFIGNRELTNIVNNGHTRQTSYVIKTNKEGVPVKYSTFVAMALAAIGRLPERSRADPSLYQCGARVRVKNGPSFVMTGSMISRN